MKRFMKSCGIAALILIVVGISLGMAGRAAVDKITIWDVVNNVTGGRFGIYAGHRGYWNSAVDEITIVEDIGVSQAPEYAGICEEAVLGCDTSVMWQEGAWNAGDTFGFDENYAVLKGDIPMYCPGVNIRKLDIEVGGDRIVTMMSDDGNVYLEATDMHRFPGYVEDGTLYIRSAHSFNSWHDHSWSGGMGNIFLYLPENYCFDEVEAEVGAGEMFLEGLGAVEASLEVGAGTVELSGPMVRELEVSIGAGMVSIWEMTVTDLEVEVGMGEFTASGILNGNADVECSMGSVDLGLDGRYIDFNYCMEGALGNIQVGNNVFGGIGQERTIDNGAGKNIDIECAMGSASVWFTE